MDRRMTLDLATAFSIAFIVIFTFGILILYSQHYCPYDTPSLQHTVLAIVPNFIVGAVTRHSQRNGNIDKQAAVNRHTKNNGKISVFKGRGAVRNLAIFHILVEAGPLSMGDIQRRLNRIKGL